MDDLLAQHNTVFEVLVYSSPVERPILRVHSITYTSHTLVQNMNKKAVLSQGKPRDAAVNFDTYRIFDSAST